MHIDELTWYKGPCLFWPKCQVVLIGIGNRCLSTMVKLSRSWNLCCILQKSNSLKTVVNYNINNILSHVQLNRNQWNIMLLFSACIFCFEGNTIWVLEHDITSNEMSIVKITNMIRPLKHALLTKTPLQITKL